MFNETPDDLDMHVIYDVSHNIAKVEEHFIDGKQKTLLVHRKGSTRAFPPHHPLIPVDYQVSLVEPLFVCSCLLMYGIVEERAGRRAGRTSFCVSCFAWALYRWFAMTDHHVSSWLDSLYWSEGRWVPAAMCWPELSREWGTHSVLPVTER